MDQDALTIVALVVSLIALLIALFQMTQASFLTAEGSRKCKSAIMGKWFILTRWNFIKTELRYEVKFTTPDIDLVNISDVVHVSPDLATSKRFSKKSVFEAETRPRWSYARFAQHVLGWHTLPYIIEEMWERDTQRHRLVNMLEKTDGVRWTPWQIWRYIHDCWRVLFQQDPGDEFSEESDTMVSWDSFLRLTYLYQCFTIVLQQQAVHSQMYAPLGKEPSIREASTGTLASVKLRQHTWDVMPPDVVRPLARSRLGCLIVLARRLGMQWEEIQLRDRNFRAEGRGLSLSSKTVQGIGVVMEFRSDTPPKSETIQIPSTIFADKMLFGILPGCEELRIQDYHLNSDTRKVQLESFFKQIGVHDTAWEAVRDRYWFGPMVVNDLVSLLCPFLPSEQSPVLWFPHPIAFEGKGTWAYYTSSFHWWEGRKMWLLMMKERMDQPRFQGRRNMGLAYEALDSFRTQFDVEFYLKPGSIFRKQQSPHMSHGASERVDEQAQIHDIQRYIQKLRSMHNQTTNYFKHLNGRDTETEPSNCYALSEMKSEKEVSPENNYYDVSGINITDAPRISYRGLVRAFINVMSQLVLGSRDPPKMPEHKIFETGRGETYNHMMAGLVERLMDTEKGLMQPLALKWLRDQKVVAPEVSDVEIEEAYFILIVRGISWKMPLFWQFPNADKLVPSSLYDSAMPIWLT